MKKTSLITILLILSTSVFAQQNLAQFAIWKPKEGQQQNFENGYKQHLQWHKSNGDKWGWHGWFIVSGPRYGQFIDATFDHTWSDFDNAIKPADDMADNRLHVFPFGDVQTVFKVSFHPHYSTADTFNNKLKLVRLLTLTASDNDGALKVVDKLREFYVSQKIKSFRVYKIIDGGLVNQLILMLGFNSWEEYGISESFQEKISVLEQSLKSKVITGISSETLVYRADMSLFPG